MESNVKSQEVKSRVGHGTYTVQYVLDLAKTEGWQKSADWRKSSMSSYVTACKNGWLGEVYSTLGWKQRQRKTKTETVETSVVGQDLSSEGEEV